MSEIEVKYAKFDEIKTDGLGFANPRQKYDKVELKELADNIATRGLKQPLVLWETLDEEGNPALLLVGGSRRYAAIGMLVEREEANGLREAVPYTTFKGTLKDAKIEALADNLHRADLTPFELASYMSDLVTMGMEQREIAEKLSRSAAWVSRTLSTYNRATPPLLKAWQTGKVPTETVMELATLDPDEQEAALTEQVEAREGGGRKAAGEARKQGKKRANKMERASVKELTEVLVLSEGAPKDNDYLQGLITGVKFAAGLVSMNQLGKPWKEFQKAKTEAAAAKAKAKGRKASSSDDDEDDE
jgi:ParB/RepB/Spo0J family partition protein